MRILVLGSAGQIGLAFCRYLPSTEHTYLPFDLSYGPEYDLRSRTIELEEAISYCDMVLFLAYDVGGSSYLEKYQSTYSFIDNNVRMMQVVFSLCKSLDRKVIFASSQMSMMPWSAYGTLKRVGELYTNAIGGVVVHFWNVYGLESDETKFHVITDFARSAVGSGRIEMRTTGQESRQFLHATDCSRALVVVAENHERWVGRVANITSFEWTKIVDLAHLVAQAAGGDVRVIPGTKVDTVQGVMNEPDKGILEVWQPQIPLSVGVQSVVDFYKEGTQ